MDGQLKKDVEVKPASRLAQFHARLQEGELKSIADWAMEFFDHDTLEWTSKIRQMMSALRRKGIMVFTVVSDDKGGKVVKIVNRNLTEFVASYNRHAANSVEPSILASFRIAEALVREHPKAREVVIERAKHLLEVAAEANKTMLGLTFKPSDHLLIEEKKKG